MLESFIDKIVPVDFYKFSEFNILIPPEIYKYFMQVNIDQALGTIQCCVTLHEAIFKIGVLVPRFLQEFANQSERHAMFTQYSEAAAAEFPLQLKIALLTTRTVFSDPVSLDFIESCCDEKMTDAIEIYCMVSYLLNALYKSPLGPLHFKHKSKTESGVEPLSENLEQYRRIKTKLGRMTSRFSEIVLEAETFGTRIELNHLAVFVGNPSENSCDMRALDKFIKTLSGKFERVVVYNMFYSGSRNGWDFIQVNVFSDLKHFLQCNYEVAIFSDVNNFLSLLAATARIAKKQYCILGMIISPGISEIDGIFCPEWDDQKWYCEKVLTLPGMACTANISMESEHALIPGHFRKPRKNHVLCPWNKDKLNFEFIKNVNKIYKDIPVTLHICLGGGMMPLQMNVFKKLYLGKLEPKHVITNSEEEYHENLKTCEYAIGCYPYTSFTGVVDALNAGIPFLTMSGLPGMHNSTQCAGKILSLAGYPEFIAYSPEEFGKIIREPKKMITEIRQLPDFDDALCAHVFGSQVTNFM